MLWRKLIPLASALRGLFGVLLVLGCLLPAAAAPNAPTLLSVEGKAAVPGTPIYLNITTGITLSGNAEANKTLRVYNNGTTLLGSTTSNGVGAYNLDIALGAGTHSLTVIANDVTGDSAPSTQIQVVIDTLAPTLSIGVYSQRGDDFSGYNYMHVDPAGEWWSNLNGGLLQSTLGDSGGSGFDLATATLTLNEINDSGTVLANIAGAALQTSLTTVKFRLAAPTADGNYAAVLIHGRRYRLTATVQDRAGNSSFVSKDWVIDNLGPQARAEGTAFRSFYIFNADDASISFPPPLSKLVPMVWVAGNGRYEVAPGFNDNALVDASAVPKAIRFNRMGFYGSLYAADTFNPPLQVGKNTESNAVINSSIFGWDSSASVGNLSSPDANGNLNTYYFMMPQPLPNGGHHNSIFPRDGAENYEYRTYYVNVQSNDPVPSHPSISTFRDSTNAAITYWDRGRVYGYWDWPMLRTANGNDILVEGTVSSLGVTQVAEIVDGSDGTTVYGRVSIPPGTTTYQIRIGSAPSEVGGWSPAVSVLPNKNSRYLMTRARTATKSTSGVCWSCNGGWVIYKHDDIVPQIRVVEPARGQYYHGVANALGAANTPLSYRAEVLDLTYPGNHGMAQAPINTTTSKIELINPFGAVLPMASQSAWSVIENLWQYTRTITLSSQPTTEGLYRLRGTLQDIADYNPNQTVTENLAGDALQPLYYYVDNTAPNAINIVPGGGLVSSIPSFNADIVDPNLSNAPANTPGSGAQLDLGQNQIDAYRFIGLGTPSSAASLTITVQAPKLGQAVDHQGNVLPVGAELQVWDSSNTIVGIVGIGNSLMGNATVVNNGGSPGQLQLTMKAPYQSLNTAQTYRVFYTIPHFDSNDGIQKVAAVPIQPAIFPGTYASRITGQDRVGNINTTVAIVNIEMNDPPAGTITLTPASSNVYIMGTAPNERTLITSSVILGQSLAPVPAGTLITVSVSSPGVIVEPDANGVAADGHQIAVAANGTISFTVRALDTTTRGASTVTASAGTASGTTTVNMVRPVVSITKSADVVSRDPGQVITYTLSYSNTGNSDASNVLLIDQIPNGTAYIANTIVLNGVPQSDVTAFQTVNNRVGVTLPVLAAGAAGNLTFQVRVQ